MKSFTGNMFLALIMLFLLPCNSISDTTLPDDTNALEGLKTVKAVYDVRTNSPKALLFILKVIEQTESGLHDQGVGSDFILSFRGGTLPLLTKNPQVKDAADKAILAEVRERLTAMGKKGVPLEACNVAAGIFKVKQDDLADDLDMVGNSLTSLIGYQNKGYAIVPMY